VLLALAMAAAFVYWYADSRDARDYNRYEIYFDGSVSGLSEGGAVRYLGVDVGRVVRLRLDPRAADRVQVIVDIDSTAPVSDRTLAQLSLQGVTGLLYLDLLLESEKNPYPRVMAAVPSENYPVIRSVRSNFDTLLQPAARSGRAAGRCRGTRHHAAVRSEYCAFSRLLSNLERAAIRCPAP
jgi:phospholipid/cholesterol/gamma-HCH transport system substrate-binding protein